MRKATDYVDAVYGPRFAGLRKTPEQALSWPRGAMGWGSLISVPVQRATAEIALRVISGIKLFPDAEAAIVKEKVDVIETTYALPTGPRFGFVNAMLLPLLRIAGAAQSPFVKLARV